jgi:glycine/D-amino acid oxidase-like deaminating enzyme
LAPADYVQVATTTESASRLEREYAGLKDAGFDAAWLPARRARQALGTDAEAALKLAGAGVIDPFRACTGIARLAAKAGALLCEDTEVSRVRVRRHGVEVETTGGTISASTVVFATRTPAAGLRALDRHFWTEERYGVALPGMTPAEQKRLGFAGLVVQDLATPSHAWRWGPNGSVLFSGAAQRPVPARLQERTLVQRTGQLMYELSLHYPHVSGTPAASGWRVPVTTAGDGLPIVGAHRSFPRHLFALGFGDAGVSGAWLAARVIARRWSDAVERDDDLFGFGR